MSEPTVGVPGAGTSEKKKSGCGFGCALLIGMVLGVGLLIALGIALCFGGASCLQHNGGISKFIQRHEEDADFGEDEMPSLEETWSSGGGEVKVVRIPVTGLIMLGEDSSPWYAGNATTALRSIRRATKDEDVKAIILEVDSGGGGITASDIIYKALKDFKAEQDGRVIVTLMGDMAASGAYYISLPSDYIFAHPTTLTGSIGVIMQSYNIKGLAEKLGVSDVTIKSGANKDLLNPFKDVDPGQRQILQAVIDAMYDRFLTLVAENRKLPKDVVRPLADGRVFVAKDALDNKLIDGIGYMSDAKKKVQDLLKVDDLYIIRYSEQMSWRDLFARPGIGFSTDLSRLMREDDTKLMYRWSPATH
jgi:protease-4